MEVAVSQKFFASTPSKPIVLCRIWFLFYSDSSSLTYWNRFTIPHFEEWQYELNPYFEELTQHYKPSLPPDLGKWRLPSAGKIFTSSHSKLSILLCLDQCDQWPRNIMWPVVTRCDQPPKRIDSQGTNNATRYVLVTICDQLWPVAFCGSKATDRLAASRASQAGRTVLRRAKRSGARSNSLLFIMSTRILV